LARAQEGLIALWKGWLPSVIGVIPYVGLNFAVYETLKDVVLKFYGAAPSRPGCMPGTERTD
jgi:solute carrier family 25 phosphate transporter 23/24/25/41